MIDDVASARAAIGDALEIVLPGRVQTWPAGTRRYVAPSIVVEQPRLAQAGTSIVAQFPVWVFVDGTVQAQMAMLDDLTWNAWLALTPIADTLDASPQTVGGLRAQVIDCVVVVAVGTLCGAAPPQTVIIPTEPRSNHGL